MCFGKFFKKQFSILFDIIAIFESVRWFVSFLNSGIINLDVNLWITYGTFEDNKNNLFLISSDSFIEFASIILKNGLFIIIYDFNFFFRSIIIYQYSLVFLCLLIVWCEIVQNCCLICSLSIATIYILVLNLLLCNYFFFWLRSDLVQEVVYIVYSLWIDQFFGHYCIEF